MPRKCFPHPPVSIFNWSKPGVVTQIGSVEAAIEELEKWGRGGKKFARALKVCGDSLAGKATPEAAKKAFEAAAKEAKVWVPYRDP